MKSDEHVAIIDEMFDTEKVDSPFGKRYGSEKLILTAEHLQALQQGKLLVKRNILRFPEAFRLQLTEAEKRELVTNCDRLEPLKQPPRCLAEKEFGYEL